MGEIDEFSRMVIAEFLSAHYAAFIEHCARRDINEAAADELIDELMEG